MTTTPRQSPIRPTDPEAIALARDLMARARTGALGVVDPDSGLEVPPELGAATIAFCDAVEKHFPVWACHIVGNFKVRVTGSPGDPKVEVINDVE